MKKYLYLARVLNLIFLPFAVLLLLVSFASFFQVRRYGSDDWLYMFFLFPISVITVGSYLLPYITRLKSNRKLWLISAIIIGLWALACFSMAIVMFQIDSDYSAFEKDFLEGIVCLIVGLLLVVSSLSSFMVFRNLGKC